MHDGNSPPKRWSRPRKVATIVAGLIVVWLAVSYIMLPAFWKRYARKHPSLEDIPGITHTAAGTPGDALNVALIGTQADVQKIMQAAKWFSADPLGLRSDLEIAEATVLKRPYDEAPVSSLYLFGRKEDLAFEQPVGKDPRQRHHVRFWRSEKVSADGRPVWLGAATFDERVGFSHTTGEITHHIASDVDTERDHVMSSLEQTGNLAERYVVSGFHKSLQGRNGGGDLWHTDGNLYVGVIAEIIRATGP